MNPRPTLLTHLALLMLLGCSGSIRTAAPGGELHAFPADDERIGIMGRYAVDDDGGVRFGASGVTFFVRFEGTRLAVELEDEVRDGTGYNWFTVVVDGGEPVRFRTEPGKRRYTLAGGLRPGAHTLVLSKATEGQNGRNRLVAVHADALLPSDPMPGRAIEFVGDSITAGYGLDVRPVACDEGTWFDQTHAWLSFAPRLARRLDARWMLTAVSGIGMHRNWNSLSPVMPDVYGGLYADFADTSSAWDFDRYDPDLVVVALGTNDFSKGDGETPRDDLDGEAFVRDYTRFVERIRAIYPGARLLLLNSPTLGPDERARLDGYLQQVVDSRRAAGDDAVATYPYEGHYATGCSGHPDLQEHVAMTDELEPVVRALMGW